MRQRIDADAEFADGLGLLEQFAVDAAGPQHQRGGQSADTAADDNRLHRPCSTRYQTSRECRLKSHSPSLRRKRLCRLRLEFGPGLRLSLNFEVLEILPVADAIAENLLLGGSILRRGT